MHSNATMFVGLQSMQSRVLEQKLSFPQRLLDNETEGVSKRVLESVSERITDLCLVRNCKKLEEVCAVECTAEDLDGGREVGEENERNSEKRGPQLSPDQMP